MIVNVRLRHTGIAALAALSLLAAGSAGQALAQSKTTSTLEGRYSIPDPPGATLEFRADGTIIAHGPKGASEPMGTYTRHGTDVELLDAHGASMGHLLVDAKGCMHSKEQPQKVMCPLPAATASSQGPSGTYSTNGGTPKFTFKPGGKVEVDLGGGVLGEGTYRVEDSKVKFFDMQGRGAVLNFDGANCLVSQVFGRMCKP